LLIKVYPHTSSKDFEEIVPDELSSPPLQEATPVRFRIPMTVTIHEFFEVCVGTD
jgi:hypothetical protein